VPLEPQSKTAKRSTGATRNSSTHGRKAERVAKERLNDRLSNLPPSEHEIIMRD
jgi:hypothetical protein